MDERASTRVVTDLSIPAVVSGVDSKVYVYNLSVGGCMVEAIGRPLEKQDRLSLTLLDRVSIDGEVVWQHGHYAGVQFLEELHPAVVEHLGFKPKLVDSGLGLRNDRFGRPLANLPPLTTRQQSTREFDSAHSPDCAS